MKLQQPNVKDFFLQSLRTGNENSLFFCLSLFFLWQLKETNLNINIVEVVAGSFGGGENPSQMYFLGDARQKNLAQHIS